MMTWWALDEITETFFPENPETRRSAVYRTFVRGNVNKVPQKEKAKKFKEPSKASSRIPYKNIINL